MTGVRERERNTTHDAFSGIDSGRNETGIDIDFLDLNGLADCIAKDNSRAGGIPSQPDCRRKYLQSLELPKDNGNRKDGVAGVIRHYCNPLLFVLSQFSAETDLDRVLPTTLVRQGGCDHTGFDRR